MIICQILIFAGSNRKWKIVTKRVDTRCWVHASYVCVTYDTVRGCISKIIRFIGRGEGAPGHIPPVSARLRSRDMKHIKTKNFWHLLSLALCEVFSITSHFTCFNFSHIFPYEVSFRLLQLALWIDFFLYIICSVKYKSFFFLVQFNTPSSQGFVSFKRIRRLTGCLALIHGTVETCVYHCN